MRYVCLLALLLPAAFAQDGKQDGQPDGATIYMERCASCHDKPEGRVPSLATIKGMTGEAVYTALSAGTMKSQAEGLSLPQIFALLGYIAPTGAVGGGPVLTRTCAGDAPGPLAADAPHWTGWGAAATNTRFQDAAAAGLTAADVPKLKLKWAFHLGAVTTTRSQPMVAGGRVFIPSANGAVYALDAQSGCTEWGFKADAAVRSGVTLGEADGTPALFFGDGGSNLYAVDAATGKQIWKVHPENHFGTVVTAAPQSYQGVVYQGFSSIEEAIAADPTFECCTFRGSVVALEAATGKKLWQSFTIPEEPHVTGKNAAGAQQHGPSGAAVWSTPTIDAVRGALYVATGDNYSDPVTETSDAILAMDLKTGKLLWSRQLTQGDAYNIGCTQPGGNCPEKAGPDFDFGQPPMLVSLGGGKRALVIGQKSGMVHAVDPDAEGKILWQTRAGEGSALGGSQWGSAADGAKVYVAISDVGIGAVVDPKLPQGYKLTLDPTQGGGLHAVDLKTGKIVWSAKATPCAEGRTDCSPAQSAAVSGIPGAVFSGSVDGHLRAYSTSTGEVLWDVDTEQEFKAVNGDKPAHGGSIDVAGPAIAGGMVFVTSGYPQWGGMPGNVLLAFSVDGR